MRVKSAPAVLLPGLIKMCVNHSEGHSVSKNMQRILKEHTAAHKVLAKSHHYNRVEQARLEVFNRFLFDAHHPKFFRLGTYA